MPSKNLENKLAAARSVGERLLFLLKTRGPQSASELGKLIGSTSENARQQLNKLRDEGLAVPRSESRGIGRPTSIWYLTDTGQRRFPDSHADLTVQLIRTVRETFGDQALDKLIETRELESRESYQRELEGLTDPQERVARLADIRTREGYMAEWHVAPDGALILIENHCPICAAATICQSFCRAELAVFQEALGPELTIERTEHIPAGARRCAYRITAI